MTEFQRELFQSRHRHFTAHGAYLVTACPCPAHGGGQWQQGEGHHWHQGVTQQQQGSSIGAVLETGHQQWGGISGSGPRHPPQQSPFLMGKLIVHPFFQRNGATEEKWHLLALTKSLNKCQTSTMFLLSFFLPLSLGDSSVFGGGSALACSIPSRPFQPLEPKIILDKPMVSGTKDQVYM